MFKFKTHIEKSSIHGMGCFADELIPKGSVIWEYVPNFDLKLTDVQYEALPPIAREFVDNFCYYNEGEGGFVICMDNAKYTNHSEDANMEPFDKFCSVARRDIQVGEEITENYFKFDKMAEKKLNSLT